MPRSFLQHTEVGGATTWIVAFFSFAQSHGEPKQAGFRFDGGTRSWRTQDPVCVARLCSARDSVVEAVAPTIAAFDEIRPSLPDNLRHAPIVLVDAAPVDPAAARRLAAEAERVAFSTRRAQAEAGWLVERERQALGLEAPSGADAEIVIRYHPEGVFLVRHPGRGRFARMLRDRSFAFNGGVWSHDSHGAALRLAAEIAWAIAVDNGGVGAVPATLEAARELARLPAGEVGYVSYPPRLVVVSTEADEDAKIDGKTMAHLTGADAGMIEAAYDACRILAADDPDKARRRNAIGFGKAHVDIGHRLATMTPEHRTARDDAFALKLSRLHRKQLPAELADAIGKAAA